MTDPPEQWARIRGEGGVDKNVPRLCPLGPLTRQRLAERRLHPFNEGVESSNAGIGDELKECSHDSIFDLVVLLVSQLLGNWHH